MTTASQKVMVDVREGERGEIHFTESDGREHTYYPCRNIWLDVQSLAVSTSLGEPTKKGEPPKVMVIVTGTARLEDHGIAVVGDPASKVRTLSISFRTGDWTPEPASPPEGEILSLYGSVVGSAMLGFSRANWEIGSDDEWWISCYVPEPFLAALVTAIRADEIEGMRVVLGLSGLFTTEHSYSPVSSRGDLFLRPDKRDNSIEQPEPAQGNVRAVQFKSAKRDLVDLDKAAAEVEDEPPNVPSPIPVDQTPAAIAALGVQVDALRRTIKWTGVFIVIALLFVAGR